MYKIIQDTHHRLKYNEAATRFVEGLPLGNGKQGMMVYGDGHYLLNEETLWSGPNLKQHYLSDGTHLEAVREAIFKGKIEVAEGLIQKNLLGDWKETYLPLGEFQIRIDGHIPAIKERNLYLDQGISVEVYEEAVITSFVTYVDDLIIMSIELREEAQEVTIDVSSKLEGSMITSEVLRGIFLGKAPYCVPSYEASNEPLAYSDEMERGLNYGIHYEMIREKKMVIIYMTCGTNYNLQLVKPEGNSDRLLKRLERQLKEGIAKGYSLVYQRHLEDYQKLYEENQLIFPYNDQSLLNTDQRRLAFRKSTSDSAFIALYYNYGRYLMIQSSRAGSMPSNLQGIWNENLRAPWCSNYTTNINLQMNYWPAEVTGLGECHRPLFDMLKKIASLPKEDSLYRYGSKGLVINHNLDIWLTTGPVKGSPSWAYWPMASLWLMLHLKEHYNYHQDIEFLMEMYEVLDQVAVFMNDWLIEDERGIYQTCPSTSPENEYRIEGETHSVSYASTMDRMLMKEVYDFYHMASQLLKKDQSLSEMLGGKINHMEAFAIHEEGHLLEWVKAYEEVDVGHRHLSHLIGFFPGNLMYQDRFLDYKEAGKKALLRRLEDGGDFTGWHCTWAISLLSRFGEHKKAKDYLAVLIGELTCPNLMNAHNRGCDGKELFQIDGNFGGVRAIAEMMVQSHDGHIRILPSIRELVPEGSVTGLRVMGGHLLNMSWQSAGKIELELIGGIHQEIKVVLGEKIHKIMLEKGVSQLLKL